MIDDDEPRTRLEEIEDHLAMFLGLDHRDFAHYAYDDLNYLLPRVRELETVLAGLLEIRESFAEHELQAERGLTAEQIKERWAAAEAALAEEQ